MRACQNVFKDTSWFIHVYIYTCYIQDISGECKETSPVCHVCSMKIPTMPSVCKMISTRRSNLEHLNTWARCSNDSPKNTGDSCVVGCSGKKNILTKNGTLAMFVGKHILSYLIYVGSDDESKMYLISMTYDGKVRVLPMLSWVLLTGKRIIQTNHPKTRMEDIQNSGPP